MVQIVHALSQRFAEFIPQHGACGAVHKRAETVAIDLVDAFASGIENAQPGSCQTVEMNVLQNDGFDTGRWGRRAIENALTLH
jgi:hypothetical protein